MITAPYATRVLGPSNLGNYAFTQSIANYFLLFCMLGINNYGTRTIAKVSHNKIKINKTFTELIFLQWIISSIVIFFYFLFCFFGNSSYKWFYISLSFYVISAAFDINWLCFGLEKFRLTVIRNAIVKSLTVICVFIFVKNHNDSYLYVFINSFGIFMSQIVIWPFILKDVKFTKVEFKDIFLHFVPNLTLFIPVIAVSIYRVMSTIILGMNISSTEVAYYTYADKLIQIPLSLVTAVTSVLMPRITSLIGCNEENEAKKLFNFSLIGVAVLCIAMSSGMMSISKELIAVYYGDKFINSSRFLFELSPIILINGLASIIRMLYLIPKKLDSVYIKSVILGAIINLVINLTLIPSIGASGAVIANIIAEITVFSIQFYYIYDEINYKQYIVDLISLIFIGLLMFIILIPVTFNSLVWTLVIKILIGFFVFIVSILVYCRVINKNSLLSNFIRLSFGK